MDYRFDLPMEDQEEIWDREYKNNESKWRRERHTIPRILKGKKVLEIGVGNGKNIPEIIKQKPEIIFAIDSSKQAIDISKRKFNQKNLNFVKRDMRNTGFSDGFFDVILCYYVLNNLLEKQRKKTISEIHRLLGKGGIVVFEDFRVGDLRQFETKEKSIEKNTIVKKNGLVCHFFNEKEIRTMFKKFKINKLEKKEFGVVLKKPELKRKLILMTARKKK